MNMMQLAIHVIPCSDTGSMYLEEETVQFLDPDLHRDDSSLDL